MKTHEHKVVHKHPLAIRWLHWINFPFLALMVWSGMQIYWANSVYRIGWGDMTLVQFFPDSIFESFGISSHLAAGLALHFSLMWLFALNGFLYVVFLVLSGQWRYIVPSASSFKESWQVFLHDLHLRKTAPPYKKYNALQRFSYTGVIFMGMAMVITGIAIFKPVQFNWLTAICGGYAAARLEHFVVTILFVLFFVVHIVQVIRSGWSNFLGMVRGFEIEKVQTLNDAQTQLVEQPSMPQAQVPQSIQQQSIQQESTIQTSPSIVSSVLPTPPNS